MTALLLCSTHADGARWLADRKLLSEIMSMPAISINDAIDGKAHGEYDVIHVTPEAKRDPEYGWALGKLDGVLVRRQVP